MPPTCTTVGRRHISLEQLPSIRLSDRLRSGSIGLHRHPTEERRARHLTTARLQTAYGLGLCTLLDLSCYGPLHTHLLSALLLPSHQGHNRRRQWRADRRLSGIKHHRSDHRGWNRNRCRLLHSLHLDWQHALHNWCWSSLHAQSSQSSISVDRISDTRGWRQ
jgi:hypothetical protein